MNWTGVILAGVALFSFLPLAIVLYKKQRARNMIKKGRKVVGQVYRITPGYRTASDSVSYRFYDPSSGRFYNGGLQSQLGKFKVGDALDVYYNPGNPALNTVQGAWQSGILLIFTAGIAVFVCWAMYQLWEMVQSGQL